MLYLKDNRFTMSPSPHSISVKNAMQIPNPGWDSNPLLINEKKYWGASNSNGFSGLSFDGTGLLGTGLFSGDISTWGVSEVVASAIGAYAIYSMVFQAKQTKYRLEGAARRHRVSKAKSLREKAKKLEEKTEGIF